MAKKIFTKVHEILGAPWVLFHLYTVTGDSYWVFDAERKITGPDSVQRLGLPVTDIQAALKWEEDSVEKVYLFKSTSYWPFNPQENQVDNVHPHSVRKWGGVPSHIDAAFRDIYGEEFNQEKQHFNFQILFLCLCPSDW